MKKLLLITLIGLTTIGFTNAQSWVFAEQFSSTGDVTPADIKVDGNGDIYIVGNYEQALTIGGLPPLAYTGIDEDIFLCKFNEQGVAQWARRIGGDDKELVGGLTIDPTNNVYVVGGFRSPLLGFDGGTTTLVNDDNYDAFLAKYDGTGSLLFADSVFWGSHVERLLDVTYDPTNDYLVMVGQFRVEVSYDDGGEQTIPIAGTSTGLKDLLLARFDPNGTFIDIETFNGTHNQSVFKNVNNSIVGGTVDGYFLTGDLRGSLYFSPTDSIVGETSAMDILIARFNDDLTYDWSRTGGGISWEHINSSGADRFGNIYFTGKAQSPSIVLDSTATLSSAPRPIIGGLWDFLIAKYNRNGNLQWFNRDGGTGEDDAFGLDVRGDRILYTGNIENDSENIQSGFAVYDLDGKLIATDSIIGDGEEVGLNVAFDLSGDSTLIIGSFDGDSLIAGPNRLDNTATGLTDGFFVKYGFEFNVYLTDRVNIPCNGEETGYIEVATQFGTEPITYEWSPNVSTGTTASDLQAGDYQIVATDAELRTDTLVVTIIEPAPIVITLGSIVATSCHANSTSGATDDGMVSISVSGGAIPFSYSWSPSGDNIEDPTSLSAGENIVTITDDNGCQAIDTFNVPQPDQITFSGSTVNNIIDPPGSNGAVNLNTQGGTPSYTFDWSGPSGFGSTDATIDSLVDNGIYNLSVTDANACVQDTSFTVALNTGITISIDTIIHVRCKGESNGGANVSVIGGSGNYTFEWRTTLGDPIGGNNPEISGLPTGTYFIKVTDNNDTLLTNETPVTINEPESSMVAAFDSTRHISCFGEADGYLRVVVTGGWGDNTYLWTPSGSTTAFDDNLDEGNHTVTITDARGCEKVLDRDISEPDELVVNIVVENLITCNGDEDGVLKAVPSGGNPPFAFAWDDPGAQIDSIATNLPAGTYRVDVTDDRGCTAFDTEVLNDDSLSIVSIDTTWDGSLGTITVTVAGGSADYTFSLSGGNNDTTASSGPVPNLEYEFTDLVGGDYTISVVDYCETERDTSALALTIGDLRFGFDLLLYPNPSLGQFTIELDNPDRVDIDLEIISLTGQLVFRQMYKSYGESRFIQTIDLGHQASGAYFMRINGLPVKAKLMIE